MHRTHPILLLLLFLARASCAQEAFEAKTFSDASGKVLPYRIHLPADLKPGEKAPLILFFHGAGERGDDNGRQLQHSVRDILAYTEKRHFPAIIVAPQCPAEKQWVNVPWSGDAHTMPPEPSESMRLAMALVQQSLKELPVDSHRLYITGISMGGFGVWDFVQREPALFAAAIPVCGGGDLAMAGAVKNLPVWAFHGDRDPIVKVSRSRNMIAAVREAGGAPKYTEYPGVEHDSWTRTFRDDAVLDWLFAQRR